MNLEEKLFQACENNDPYVVYTLLNKGISINIRDKRRYSITPLILAAINNHYNIIIILLLYQNNLKSNCLFDCDDQGILTISIRSIITIYSLSIFYISILYPLI